MKEKFSTVYAPHDDITFIMRQTFDRNGECRSLAVVGWYYGEPDEISTDDEIEVAADHIMEEYEFWDEYNSRCGIHSVNVEILMDNYFSMEECY